MQFLWFLHSIRNPVLTALFSFFTLFGEEIVLVAVLCILYWCVDKELAFGVCISFFVSTLLVQGLKIAIRIDRPWVLDPSFAPIQHAIKTATGYSFPSGHTQSAAAIFGYLGVAAGKRWQRIACWAVVLLVGLSRMYLGVHTPLDVIGALAITLLVVIITHAYLRSGRSDMALSITVGLISVAVMAYAFFLHGRQVIDAHYLADCCKAAGGCIGCAIGFIWARRKIPFSPRAGVLWQQVVKLLLGIAGLMVFKSGVKAVFGDSLPIDAIRYFLIGVWALALYPLLFSKVLKIS